MLSKTYSSEFELFAVCLGVVDSSAVEEYGLFHVFCEVFRGEFFEFFPFSNKYGSVCVFEAVDDCCGILDFVFENLFSDGYSNWIVSCYVGAFFNQLVYYGYGACFSHVVCVCFEC